MDYKKWLCWHPKKLTMIVKGKLYKDINKQIYKYTYIRFFSFLGYLKREDSSAKNRLSDLEEEEQEDEELYTNERNLHWTINLLRILQMLTKRKTHRIVLLVQYKSSVSIMNKKKG